MLKLIDYKKANETITVAPTGLHQIVLAPIDSNVEKTLDIVLAHEGSEVQVLCVYVGLKEQKVNLTINSTHKAPNTKCLIQVRGVLKGSSYSTFKGLIKIGKKAQLTNSYLDDDVLILGDGARNESQPTLEIEADDVKATHGATTGQISKDHLFYLQSRGLTKEQAENIILEGFFDPVISKISDIGIRELVYKSILERLSLEK